MKLSFWGTTLFVSVFCFAQSCHKTENDTSADSGPDADTDTDTDSDTDSDADGDSDPNQLSVDPADQNCQENSKCVAIPTTCPFNSYAAINAAALDKYNEQLQHLCDGLLPERPLFTPVADCEMNSTCMLTGIAAAVDFVADCLEPEECVSVLTQCDACECFGLPINADHQAEATALFSNICGDYGGSVCDIDCPEQPVLTCLEGRCSWVD